MSERFVTKYIGPLSRRESVKLKYLRNELSKGTRFTAEQIDDTQSLMVRDWLYKKRELNEQAKRQTTD